MTKVMEFPLAQGGSVMVEVDDSEAPPSQEGLAASDAITKAESTLEDAVAKVVPAARSLVTMVSNLAGSPDEILIQFGITLSAQAGVIFARGGAAANFLLTLSWKKPAGPQTLAP